MWLKGRHRDTGIYAGGGVSINVISFLPLNFEKNSVQKFLLVMDDYFAVNNQPSPQLGKKMKVICLVVHFAFLGGAFCGCESSLKKTLQSVAERRNFV